jgi:hypothetical protein
MAGGDRSNADARLLAALAGGSTVADAAQQAGIGERTAYRRLDDPTFRAQLDDARQQTIQAAIDTLSATATEAAATLRDLLRREAYSPAIRLGAARSILELGARLREANEIEQRLAALEARLADVRGQNGRP